jgi:hypothetical protein
MTTRSNSHPVFIPVGDVGLHGDLAVPPSP